jgi:hypothetical protein
MSVKHMRVAYASGICTNGTDRTYEEPSSPSEEKTHLSNGPDKSQKIASKRRKQ